MKKKIHFTIFLFAALAFLSSCGKEQFVDATALHIWTHDTIETEIYVDGELATTFQSSGRIYMNSGTYEIIAKQNGQEVDKVKWSAPVDKEGNYDRYVFNVRAQKDYALIDMSELYEPSKKYKVKKKYFGEHLLKIKSNTYKTYFPGRTLPSTIYGSGINQLFELPAGYESKSNEEIISYCKTQIK